MEKITTIKVKESVKRKLEKFKAHPRESYNNTIDRLSKAIQISMKNPELSVWEIFEALEADERTKRGEGYIEEEARKILGI